MLATLLLPGPAAHAWPGPRAPGHPAAATVTVAGFAFTPKRVSVPLGGEVAWSFPETMNYTTTSDDGFWDSGRRSGGATYGRTFATAGATRTTAGSHHDARARWWLR